MRGWAGRVSKRLIESMIMQTNSGWTSGVGIFRASSAFFVPDAADDQMRFPRIEVPESMFTTVVDCFCRVP